MVEPDDLRKAKEIDVPDSSLLSNIPGLYLLDDFISEGKQNSDLKLKRKLCLKLLTSKSGTKCSTEEFNTMATSLFTVQTQWIRRLT